MLADHPQARKLRELFKGRFSDDESLELLKEYDSLSDAVDFILNSKWNINPFPLALQMS